MPKFRKIEDVYGRFLDYEEMDAVPVAILDENGNTIVMSQKEYKQFLEEQREQEEEQEKKP